MMQRLQLSVVCQQDRANIASGPHGASCLVFPTKNGDWTRVTCDLSPVGHHLACLRPG